MKNKFHGFIFCNSLNASPNLDVTLLVVKNLEEISEQPFVLKC